MKLNLMSVIAYTQHKHAARNRVMVLLTFYAGMRVGEVASLKWADAFEADGKIKTHNA